MRSRVVDIVSGRTQFLLCAFLLKIKLKKKMSKHNYTNPAFCQNSEFYPVPSAHSFNVTSVESPYNRSANLSLNSSADRNNKFNGPLRIQRSMSTRSFVAQKVCASTRKVDSNRQEQLRLHYEKLQLQKQRQQNFETSNNLNATAVGIETRSGSGRYALVPVEQLTQSGVSNGRYAIVPETEIASLNKVYAKSQDQLDKFPEDLDCEDEQDSTHQFTSLPPMFCEEQMSFKRRQCTAATPTTSPKIKHAFSSDFGSKSFLIVDKNSNQRYQMVPTAEDEELVDENHEIIQMHNGRAHRYAVIPTEDDDNNGNQYLEAEEEEEETCLSNTELNETQNYDKYHMPMRSSTPQRGVSTTHLHCTPMKNPAATKLLHELLSTPRKPPLERHVQSTPRKTSNRSVQMTQERRLQLSRLHSQSQHQIYYGAESQPSKTQRQHYETVRPTIVTNNCDRTMAVISPRVAGSKSYAEEDDCSSIHGNSPAANNSYPQKVVNATITLAIVSLMLVLGSAMNSGLIIYMIAHFGKSFYLQFGLVSAFCGVGLGILGFRSRQCEWLPNRSYISGYILVTLFCLLKCCGLLVILVLEPYPGLPFHDVTTGVILGLSSFSMFFIGLGVIGSLWCYRPPPDNRVNVA